MSDLKPCPFCGGQSLELNVPENNPNFNNWVLCETCCGTSGFKSTQELAINAWNTRVQEAKFIEIMKHALISLENIDRAPIFEGCNHRTQSIKKIKAELGITP